MASRLRSSAASWPTTKNVIVRSSAREQVERARHDDVEERRQRLPRRVAVRLQVRPLVVEVERQAGERFHRLIHGVTLIGTGRGIATTGCGRGRLVAADAQPPCGPLGQRDRLVDVERAVRRSARCRTGGCPAGSCAAAAAVRRSRASEIANTLRTRETRNASTSSSTSSGYSRAARAGSARGPRRRRPRTAGRRARRYFGRYTSERPPNCAGSTNADISITVVNGTSSAM